MFLPLWNFVIYEEPSYPLFFILFIVLLTWDVGRTGLWFHLAGKNTEAQGNPGISSLPFIRLGRRLVFPRCCHPHP